MIGFVMKDGVSTPCKYMRVRGRSHAEGHRDGNKDQCVCLASHSSSSLSLMSDIVIHSVLCLLCDLFVCVSTV